MFLVIPPRIFFSPCALYFIELLPALFLYTRRVSEEKTWKRLGRLFVHRDISFARAATVPILNVRIDAAVALLSWFPNVSPGAPTHWPPTSTTSGRLTDGLGITKIRGSMIYNGVMGAWDDTALLLLPAGIIAGGWPRHCPGANQRERSTPQNRAVRFFIYPSAFAPWTLNKYYSKITCS